MFTNGEATDEPRRVARGDTIAFGDFSVRLDV
jgi:hypothetical protein